MNIQPIHIKTAYKAALKRVSTLVDLDPKRGTALGNELEILRTLVQVYEAEYFSGMPNLRAESCLNP